MVFGIAPLVAKLLQYKRTERLRNCYEGGGGQVRTSLGEFERVRFLGQLGNLASSRVPTRERVPRVSESKVLELPKSWPYIVDGRVHYSLIGVPSLYLLLWVG